MTYEQIIESEAARLGTIVNDAHQALNDAGVDHAGDGGHTWSMTSRIRLLSLRANRLEAVARKAAHLDPSGTIIDTLRERLGGSSPTLEAVEQLLAFAHDTLVELGIDTPPPTVELVPGAGDDMAAAA